MLAYEINILYIVICFDNKNIMPQYKTLESRTKEKTHQRRVSNDDPQYVSRLRQVLLKNQSNSGQHYVQDRKSQEIKILKGYNEHPPQSDEQSVVYVIKQKPKKSQTQPHETKLPKIKTKGKEDAKKSKINRNELLLIRNYMNADLVPFEKTNRKKKVSKNKKRYLTVDDRPSSNLAGETPQQKTYIVHTPIKQLDQDHEKYPSSRTQRIDRNKSSMKSQQINSYKVGKSKKYERIPNPQYYSSVIELQRDKKSESTLRQSVSPHKQRLGREKSNEKSWEEINPLILTTQFCRLKEKILKTSPKQSANQSTLIQEKKKLQKIPLKENISKFIRNYIPEYVEIKIEELIKKENFEIIFDENETAEEEKQLYFGETKNSKRHGQGISIKDKAIFQGEWINGEKKIGIEKTDIGTYKGEFKDNKRNGKGEYFWKNGQYYSGQWTNGKKNGSGYWKSFKDESYMGQWNNGEVSGYGVHVMKNGQRYEGQFKNFLKHGFGKQEFPNGDWYSGKYVQGKPHGPGKYTWKIGVMFQGEFIEGSREGQGKIFWENRIEFEGQFKKDLPNGTGRILYPDGEEFNGNFQFGLKNGLGILNLRREKKVIKGKWKDDILFEQSESP